MASITDCVSEGLKYPLNDVKKLLNLGVFFIISNIILFGIFEENLHVFRVLALVKGTLSFRFSQIPPNDIYIIAALTVISFIISLIILGYQYIVIKFSIDANNNLPEFGDIANLLVNGLKYFAVSLIYNIIPTIVLIAGVELIQDVDYIMSIISFILFLICNFLLIMALANMIDSNEFKKAFDLKEITDKISKLGWVKYIGIILFTIIIYGIIMLALGIILMFISMLIAVAINQAMIIASILLIIDGLFIMPYISVFFNKVYGSIYREAIKNA